MWQGCVVQHTLSKEAELSIAAMTRLAYLEDQSGAGAAEPVPGRPTQGSNSQQNLSDALAKVSAYIPAETLAVYVPALGIANTRRESVLWVIYGACIGLTLIFVWLHNMTRRHATHRRRRFLLLNLF